MGRPVESPPARSTAHALHSNVTAGPTIIVPSRGWGSLGLAELWACRELILFFAWRDVKLRYKQTAFGVAWAVLQPLSTMVVFSLFFGRLAGMPSDGVPYPLFAMAALVPWTFFASALGQASNSVVAHQQLITKVYFPRLAIPIGSITAAVVDFAVAFALLVAMMAWFGIVPRPRIVWIAPLVLLAFLSALAVSLWLSALNVKYRDVRYALPFLTQLWLFVTPIAYPSSLLPERWQLVYALNPMAGVVEGFRWALLNAGTQPGPMLGVSAAATGAMLIGGAWYFRRMESTFADVI
jgi:lipopolysaccharide transport system permease protein